MQKEVQARTELQLLLNNTELTPKTPVLLLANKQDLPEAAPAYVIEAALSLREPWQRARATCAVTGDGLDDLFDVLHDMIHISREMRTQR